MRSIYASILFVLLLVFICPSEILAQIVINEFSSAAGTSTDPDWPDWVEIYYNDIDVTLYQLIDSTGNIKKFSDADCTDNFCTVDWSNRLNNYGDIIKLVLISLPDSPVDIVTYGESGDICAPGDGQTIGKYPDGTKNIVKFSSHTKGLANTSSQDPCSTPTPAPTKGPTSNPTSNPTPTSSPTPEPTVLAVATKKPTITPRPVVKDDERDDSDYVLGLREELMTSPSPEPGEEDEKKFPFMAGLFLFGGTGLIGVAGFTFFKNKKKEYNSKDKNEGFNKIEIKRNNN